MKLSRRALLTLAGLAMLGMAEPAWRQILREVLLSPKARPIPSLTKATADIAPGERCSPKTPGGNRATRMGARPRATG